MTRTLHLTNGKAIIDRIHAAGIPGSIVPWDDLLHDGPVPEGLGSVALREQRASFLARSGAGQYDRILREFQVRDDALECALAGGTKVPPLHYGDVHSGGTRVPPADEIVLWFEHDLYDQLQLIQILSRVPVDGSPTITAVQPATYLGAIAQAAYPALYVTRAEVTSGARIAARDAWDAFRAADPRALLDVIPRVTDLPHLAAALSRHLEQFPSVTNGLSRTEQQTLEVVRSGAHLMRDVYVKANHAREEAVFMGDGGFLHHVTSLIAHPQPLLRATTPFLEWSETALDTHVELTTAGARVVAGEADRVALCGIDRWLGGVHLEGHGPVWRWDAARKTVRFL